MRQKSPTQLYFAIHCCLQFYFEQFSYLCYSNLRLTFNSLWTFNPQVKNFQTYFITVLSAVVRSCLQSQRLSKHLLNALVCTEWILQNLVFCFEGADKCLLILFILYWWFPYLDLTPKFISLLKHGPYYACTFLCYFLRDMRQKKRSIIYCKMRKFSLR